MHPLGGEDVKYSLVFLKEKGGKDISLKVSRPRFCTFYAILQKSLYLFFSPFPPGKNPENTASS